MSSQGARKDSITRAELSLELPSKSSAVGSAVDILVSLLRECVQPERLKLVELALDEALRNAYEHGNLGLSSEQKRELCDTARLDEWLQEMEKEFGNKPIFVRASLSKDHFECSILDQGSGFDWKSSTMNQTPVSADQLHGRGVFLISKVFDRIDYNNKGNEVRLSLSLSDNNFD